MTDAPLSAMFIGATISVAIDALFADKTPGLDADARPVILRLAI